MVMHDLKIGLFLVLVLLVPTGQDVFSVQKSTQSSSVVQEQLKGLKSVYVLVYVDFDIRDNENIKREIEEIAKKMLGEAGLSLEGDQGAHLSILVYSYPVEDNAFD